MPLSRKKRNRPRLSLNFLEDRLAPVTNTWNVAAGGQWTTAANWSLGHAPLVSEDVLITGLNSGATVTLNSGSPNVHGLTIDPGNMLTLGGGNLTLTNFGSISGTMRINSANTLTVQNGATLTTNNGATMLAAESNSTSFGLVVNGTLNATGTTFSHLSTWGTSNIQIGGSGHLTATNSTFDWSNITLATGTIGAGDLNGNTFASPLTLPYTLVPFLSGAGNSNVSFEEINIQPGTQTSGTLQLNAINNTNYTFPGGFTVGNGATLAVGSNVDVVVPLAQTLTVNGTLSLAPGADLQLNSNYNGGTQVNVNGLLTSNGASITSPGQGYTTSLTINTSGRIQATNTTFTLTQLTLAANSVLNPGDLANNIFNTTLYVPHYHVPMLSAAGGGSNNVSFEDISILAGTLTSGTLRLDPINNENYVFPNGFTVGATATLAVGNNVSVVLGLGQLLTVNGTMTLAPGSNLKLSSNYNGGTQVVVNGLLQSTGASITSPGQGYTTSLTVNTSGRLRATSTTFSLTQVTLGNGSVFNPGDLANNIFNASLYLPYYHVPLLSAAGGGSDNVSFEDINILNGTISSGTLNLNQLNNQGYVFPSGFTVGSLATLEVGNNVEVFLGLGQALTVNGTMTLAPGSNLKLNSNYNGGTQVVVNGLFQANSAYVTSPGQGYTTSLTVNSGGRLKATNTTFTLTQVTLNNGSIFIAGDLAGNIFNSLLTLPHSLVPLLSAAGGGSDNVSFEDINILNGTLNSGILRLDPINNQRYRFPNGFTVGSGATLAVGNNVEVWLGIAQTLTVNGSITLAPGAHLKLNSDWTGNTQVVVNGIFQATSAYVSSPGQGYTTSMVVNTNGRLRATGTTFTMTQLTLNTGSIFVAGDLANNIFNTPLHLPHNFVPLLSAAGGGSDNVSFEEINILNGTLGSGILRLDQINNLGYGFPNGFTVGSGATLAVASNIPVLVGIAQALTVNGTMSLAPGANLKLNSDWTGNTQVVVNGLFTANGAYVTSPGQGYTTSFTVNTGGQLMATGTTLSLTQLTFANGSVLKSTDITGSTFNTTVSLPAIHAASLVDNLVFQDVIILPGSLSNGQVATLAPLGQSGTQRYIFNATTGNFTIGAGATLTIQPEARVVAVETNGTTFGIVVNGVLNVADAFLTHTGTNNSSTIAVGAGGRLTATNSQIAWSKVNLNSGGAADFQFDTFTTKLTINSGAGANIFNNDFSTNGANGVIAAGSSSATINFENNYWGSDPAAIPAMIQDNADNATLPTIDFSPNLTTPPFPFFNPTSLNLSTSGEGVSRTLTAAPGTGPATNFAVASGALPTGMALSSGGVLNGTPIAVGSYVFTVSADDFAPGVGNFVANQLYWIIVTTPTITIAPPTLPSTRINVAYNQTLTASGGVAPYTNFTVAAGILPSGLSLSTSGLISGTPTTNGTFSFTVSVQDSSTGANAPYVGAKEYSITVDDTAPIAGSVFDSLGTDIDFQSSTSILSANWSGVSDASSGIANYRWGIGTTAGATDIMAFKDAGAATSGTTSGLSLTSIGKYYVIVQAIDASGNVSDPAVSDGVSVDSNAPTFGIVNDGTSDDIDVQASTTTLSANWAAFGDPDSGIDSYELAIGLSAGGTSIRGYTNMGAVTEATVTGLSLNENLKYYITIRAIDFVGNVSAPSSSDGVTIVAPAPVIASYSVDSGVAGDSITNDATPTLTGTSRALATVKVYDNGSLLGQTVADNAGNWQYTTTTLLDGVHAFTATATNIAGNTSPLSDPLGLTILTSVPTVTINRKNGQDDPTNSSPISFDVHFSSPVVGFTSSDINLGASTVGGSLVAAITGSDADYTVTVTGMSGAGNVVASIAANAVTDVAGNANSASTSTDNSVAFDNVQPTVTINPATGQSNPAYVSPVVFAVKFSEAVTGFTSADVDLSSSTVGGTLVATVDGSGTDYTISVTGMSGIGNVVAVVSADAAEDDAGNLSQAPSGNNVVGFNDAGQFKFSSATFNTTEGAGTVVITVSRVNGSRGTVKVNYATSDDTATGGDYSSTSGELEWLDGVTGDKTFSVPITDDILSEGDERFFVTLSSPTGGALLDAPSTAAVTIAKNDPRVSGSTFSEDGTALGDQVTLKLVGGGTLEYFLTNDKGPITAINLNNTISTKSVLALTVRKPLGGTGNGRTTIGEINGGGVKLLSLAAADLVGNGIHLTDFLGSLLIGAVQNGADISLHAVKRLSGRGTAITAGVIGDGTNIELINAPLNALTAISVGAGSITAPSIGSIVIKGKGIPGTIGSIPGNFKSDIFVEGIDLPLLTPALKLLRVFGTVSDSTIQIGGAPGTIGNVGTILVGAFVNSRLFAGYTGQIDGLGTFLPSTVAVFRITGLGENSVFDNSYVIAANFNSVLVDVVEPDNDDVKFGFLYHTKMKSLKVKSPIFIFNPLGADQQEIINSDFYVKKV